MSQQDKQTLVNVLLGAAILYLLFIYIPEREQIFYGRGICVAGAEGDDAALERCAEIHR